MARSPFKATDEHRNIVHSASGMGLPQEMICYLIMDSKGKPITEKTLRKHFRHELDTGIANARVKIFQTAFKVATDSKHPAFATMNIWLQKTQCGMREGMKLELTGSGGAPLNQTPQFVVNVGDTSIPKET